VTIKQIYQNRKKRGLKMTTLVNEIGNLASFIGSLTVVGSTLLWIYNKFIGKPREKRREEEEEKKHKYTMKMIRKENEPLNESIQQLNEWLAESQADRKQLNKVTDEHTNTIDHHEKQLDNHNNRLIVLETKNGIPTYSIKKGE